MSTFYVKLFFSTRAADGPSIKEVMLVVRRIHRLMLTNILECNFRDAQPPVLSALGED